MYVLFCTISHFLLQLVILYHNVFSLKDGDKEMHEKLWPKPLCRRCPTYHYLNAEALVNLKGLQMPVNITGNLNLMHTYSTKIELNKIFGLNKIIFQFYSFRLCSAG